MAEQCKEKIFDGWRHRRCARKASRDGYCKQHHPESVKLRREAANARYEERMKRSPQVQLHEAQKRVIELEMEVSTLELALGMACHEIGELSCEPADYKRRANKELTR